MLQLLEKLCGEEEAVVRNTATKALVKIVKHLQRGDVANQYVPMLKRLANGDWFTTRVSAAGLFASAYPMAPEQVQDDLRRYHGSFSQTRHQACVMTAF
jgi:serine/threonine-protein phosphatase 2A regulatory subunit A